MRCATPAGGSLMLMTGRWMPATAAISVALFSGGASHGQVFDAVADLVGTQGDFPSHRVRLQSHLPVAAFGGGTAGNDCWGYVSPSGREYAIMGLSSATSFVDITDPTNPVIVGSVSHATSTWDDIKTMGEYAFAVNESSNGLQIIDLSDIDNGTVRHVRDFRGSGFRTAHNVALDTVSQYAYPCATNTASGFIAIDLADPENPVVRGSWTQESTHDLQVVTYTDGAYAGRELAFCFDGGVGVNIVDVTNKSSMFKLANVTYPNVVYCHQGWLSEDRQYLFADDEMDELRGRVPSASTMVFDVSDPGNPQYLTTFLNGVVSSDHNLFPHDGFVFAANYKSGLRIYDASDPMNMRQVGWFDTFPESDWIGFDGAWGCYPFLPSGNVIVSDLENGLFILDPTDALSGLDLTLPDGPPPSVDPLGITTMRVDVAEFNASHEPGTGVLHVNTGSGFQSYPMTTVDADTYEATFPTAACGLDVEFFVSAETSDGRMMTYPSSGALDPLTTISATTLITISYENFEQESGWTVDNNNLESGQWERGVPAGTGSRGDPSSDFDGSGQCFVTGNGNGFANDDVDGGPTRLITPIFDMPTAGPHTRLRMARHYFTDDGSGNDILRLYGSTNGGNSWTLISSMPAATDGWEVGTERPFDTIAASTETRFKFEASDQPNNSVTEAAIDAFEIVVPECGGDLSMSVPATVTAGEALSIDVTNATPDTNVYFLYSVTGTAKVYVESLGTTLGLASPTVGGVVVGAADGTATLTANVPPSVAGVAIWFQASEFGRPSNVEARTIQP